MSEQFPGRIAEMRIGYMSELRQAVGTRPLIVAGACVLIRDSVGRVLLHRRRDSGTWDVIGGSMELCETFEQTARREVREEIGLELGELHQLDVCSGTEFFTCTRTATRSITQALHLRPALYTERWIRTATK
jgi:8-oxo-dGTP pyrophosphatase MutT (NUDIX family)